MGRRQGPEASVAGSLMKPGITEMVHAAAVLRADVAGAAAMLDGPEAQGILAAPGGRIAGGTSQIQRTIIGERPARPAPRASPSGPIGPVRVGARMADDFSEDRGSDGLPKGKGFPRWLVAVLVVAVVSLLFISQNRRRVKVDFVVFDRFACIWVVILISMALGALLAEAIRLSMKRRRSSDSRSSG